MDNRITDKLDDLQLIIDSSFERIFDRAHEEVETASGDITPEQMARLETIKKDLLNLMMQQLEQNLPKKKLTMNDVVSKIKTKTINRIDSHDFNQIVEAAYGTPYEVEAEEEMNNCQVYSFTVPSQYRLKNGVFQDNIRKGKYPQYGTGYIAECLYEDGLLPEGTYEIKADW